METKKAEDTKTEERWALVDARCSLETTEPEFCDRMKQFYEQRRQKSI